MVDCEGPCEVVAVGFPRGIFVASVDVVMALSFDPGVGFWISGTSMV
jgi:hypothetical protein